MSSLISKVIKILALFLILTIVLSTSTNLNNSLRNLEEDSNNVDSPDKSELEPIIEVNIENEVEFVEFSDNFESLGINENDFNIKVKIENTVDEV